LKIAENKPQPSKKIKGGYFILNLIQVDIIKMNYLDKKAFSRGKIAKQGILSMFIIRG